MAGLGFEKKTLEILQKLVERPVGVMLISGPTGSGKSTTLYSMLTALNKDTINIITLEDPVEYFLQGINQVQVNPEVGLTFASGLRAILRQDPNVVMVGEIRDNETAELAIQASLTGHFMLSTIHAKDVTGVIPRLIDMHIEPFLIASALNTIMAQRLVRKICEDCKEELPIIGSIMDEIKSELALIPKDYLPEGYDKKTKIVAYRGKGCDRCNNTGYRGRIVVAEVLTITEDLRNIIITSPTTDKLVEAMRKQNRITFKQDTILKVLRGQTTIEELLRITRE